MQVINRFGHSEMYKDGQDVSVKSLTERSSMHSITNGRSHQPVSPASWLARASVTQATEIPDETIITFHATTMEKEVSMVDTEEDSKVKDHFTIKHRMQATMDQVVVETCSQNQEEDQTSSDSIENKYSKNTHLCFFQDKNLNKFG